VFPLTCGICWIQGNTALALSLAGSRKAAEEVSSFLLEQRGIKVNTVSSDGQSPSEMASKRNMAKVTSRIQRLSYIELRARKLLTAVPLGLAF
jgi:hypothetical protein